MSASPLMVTGGAGGIVAQCDELRSLAGRFGQASSDSLGAAWTLHGYLLSPAVATSSMLDPPGFARFESTLLGALDGLHGLTRAGGQCAVIDGDLRAAASGYESADHISGVVHDEIAGVAGLGNATIAGGTTLFRTRDFGRAGQAVIAADPAALDSILDAVDAPGLLASGAGALADGHGTATVLGIDHSTLARTPPRNLADVLRDLARRNDDPHHGAVDVRVLTMRDGTRRAIVDITGTKTWTSAPTTDVTSLPTDVRAIAGKDTAYEEGVLEAMRKAGIRATDAVMIVGHSEGGMVAVNAARDAVRRGEFNVTHVVTAGAPIGRTVSSLPSSVQVLALENSRDLVPHLDGVANPDQPNVTTVRSPRGDGTIEGDHDIGGAYVPLAADVDLSRDESVRAYLSGADEYFRATDVSTHSFQIRRHY